MITKALYFQYLMRFIAVTKPYFMPKTPQNKLHKLMFSKAFLKRPRPATQSSFKPGGTTLIISVELLGKFQRRLNRVCSSCILPFGQRLLEIFNIILSLIHNFGGVQLILFFDTNVLLLRCIGKVSHCQADTG